MSATAARIVTYSHPLAETVAQALEQAIGNRRQFRITPLSPNRVRVNTVAVAGPEQDKLLATFAAALPRHLNVTRAYTRVMVACLEVAA